MSFTNSPLVFDGHNDLLVNLFNDGGVEAAGLAQDRDGHFSFEKARIGGFGGGFFAIFVPNPQKMDMQAALSQGFDPNISLPAQIPWQDALPVAMEQAAILVALQDLGHLRICTTVEQIRKVMNEGGIAAIMHMEGADAIDPELNALDVLYEAGLRSIGPVWSRSTPFAEGVPFRFPSTGDIGGGLTPLGEQLIKRCNELQILIDLSHLNEAGFWDVARLSNAPLVATHSNVHALCQSSRNLTDKQLDAIRDTDGVVGLNFMVAFLREDGRFKSETPIEVMVSHLDYMIDRMGEDHVALGSDFDGAIIPSEIGDCAGLGVLRQAMLDRGYSPELITKICSENWLRVLDQTWGSAV